MKSFWLLAVMVRVASGAVFELPQKNMKFSYDEAAWEVVAQPAPPASSAEVDSKMSEQTLATIQKKLADEKYHARFSVVVDDASRLKEFAAAKDKLGTYEKHAVSFMKSQRFDILSVKPTKLSGVSEPAVEITANQRDFGLIFRQVIFLKGNEAYLLTATTRTKKFEESQGEMEKLFSSFQLK